ncbi:zinc finger protein 185 [Anarrhichthys ocellatus]|uniref:zinc finger protein 185 n=1 Tax=Anarrhichthys ocellatus TaxID=433405 RepID=UPI0012EECACF|nr:zinc finger protein 185-like [Anarrhichthys ocellatus]
MSKEVNRNTVFQTTRVRNALKNDGCWIHKSKQKQEEARTDRAVETGPSSVTHSYVLSTAKKFEDSSNQGNGEVIPPQEDAQPEGSTVETSDDAKPQAPTEEGIQKDEAHPEETVANTTAENKSNVEQNVRAADASAEVHVAEQIPNGEPQPVSSTEENPEALSPVEPVEQTVANTSPENKGEQTDKTVDQSNVEHNEAKDSVDAHMEDPVAETSVVPEKGLTEHAAEESVEAVAEVAVESSPETPDVTGAAGENAALQVSVDPVPDLVADTASESPTKAAAETAVKPEESTVEFAASAELVFRTGAEEVVKCEVQPVENPVVEQSVEPTPERAADHVVELSMKDAVEPVTSSDAEAAQDTFSCRLIELSEALDVEPPTTETAPEPLKDPKPSHTEETKLNQHPDDTNTTKSNVCSFCETIMDGKVKIYLSEPAVTCHPDCLKCGVCAKALGDLMTAMFLHDQVVIVVAALQKLSRPKPNWDEYVAREHSKCTAIHCVCPHPVLCPESFF